jgi:hypothetical protein
MPGHEHERAPGPEPREAGRHRGLEPLLSKRPERQEERIDAGIADEADSSVRDALGEQVRLCPPGRGEMELGDGGGQDPIHLLGIRRGPIPAPQPGLYVGDSHLPMEGRERSGEAGRRVALDDHPVRAARVEDAVHACQGSRRDVGERLVRAHDLQIVIHADPKERHHLGHHFPVLSREANLNLRIWASPEIVHEGRELDRLGAVPKTTRMRM